MCSMGGYAWCQEEAFNKAVAEEEAAKQELIQERVVTPSREKVGDVVDSATIQPVSHGDELEGLRPTLFI